MTSRGAYNNLKLANWFSKITSYTVRHLALPRIEDEARRSKSDVYWKEK